MLDPIRFSGCLLFAASLAAQVPTDSIVLLDWFSAGPFGVNQIVFLDSAGGGSTDVIGATPFGSPPLQGIAADAANPSDFFLLGLLNGPNAGINRVPVGMLAVPGAPDSSLWTHPGADRIRVAGGNVWTLSGGAIESTPLAGGSPTSLAVFNDAVDIAVAANKLFVGRRNAASPSTPVALIEIDLATMAQRTVGSYADVRRIAVDTAGVGLAIGTTSSAVQVAVANGNVVATHAATVGPVVAVTWTTDGSIVWGESAGLGYAVFRAGLPAPIRVHALADLVDLDVAVATTASAIPYEIGCGNGGATTWSVSGLPTLGNASFAMSLGGAPPDTLGVLFLGDSRRFSTVHAQALPMDLTAFGAPGCFLFVDPIVPLLLVSDPIGVATRALPIPATPGLAGVEWVGQGYVFDPSYTPYPFAATGGLALRIEP
ncbi:MAG: hypothetical protein JNK78_05415 [Planctomycetes bacterium]|nr:hypothetical protein [Planctomycetota bacterium]